MKSSHYYSETSGQGEYAAESFQMKIRYSDRLACFPKLNILELQRLQGISRDIRT